MKDVLVCKDTGTGKEVVGVVFKKNRRRPALETGDEIPAEGRATNLMR